MGSMVGLITARGGSKGIPRKNIASLAGKPLIAWTIKAAQESRALDRIIVSTDDPEIADVAREWGADVPFMRPPELAADDSPHHGVVIHAIRWLESQPAPPPDYIMLLQPTSPLRKAEDIDAAAAIAAEKDADAVISVCPTHDHPYISKRIADDGRLLNFVEPPKGYLPRQALPPVYALNGAIYLVRREVMLASEDWNTPRTFAYVMPPERSVDIDSPWDLHLVDVILRDLNGFTSN
ncbi:MAG: CMP-N,N-diacetyllegionaminic acid synthase [Acidobacteriota bacterium]|jgi:CMP-N-acetylneuraminic acid synthetase|nr:CMP-N,N-diacetyllegionaminic acid synthase [Acidobacteriota bacterium]